MTPDFREGEEVRARDLAIGEWQTGLSREVGLAFEVKGRQRRASQGREKDEPRGAQLGGEHERSQRLRRVEKFSSHLRREGKERGFEAREGPAREARSRNLQKGWDRDWRSKGESKKGRRRKQEQREGPRQRSRKRSRARSAQGGQRQIEVGSLEEDEVSEELWKMMDEVPSSAVPKTCQGEVKLDVRDKTYEPGFEGGERLPRTVPLGGGAALPRQPQLPSEMDEKGVSLEGKRVCDFVRGWARELSTSMLCKAEPPGEIFPLPVDGLMDHPDFRSLGGDFREVWFGLMCGLNHLYGVEACLQEASCAPSPKEGGQS